ncbi:MAG: MarR family winged helix-turn-helix transcriptional regulator, partial [Solirubrobacteraceae bacterium]
QVEQVQPPTMTRMAATMEAAGLVVRRGDAADRRVSRVELTAKGRSTLERIRRLKTAFLVRRLGELAPAERASAAELAQLLERLVEEG